MSKKMMMLATGALTALALAAFPVMASAGSPEVECAGVACGPFTIHGGTVEISRTSAPTTHCTSVTGTGNYNTKTSGTISLILHGCLESAFGSSCTSAGNPAGTVSTGSLPFQNVYLTDSKTTPGIKIGGTSTPHQINITHTCFGGFVHNRTTGSLLGHLESECTRHPGILRINFTRFQPGHQVFTQVTGTGNKTDLISSLNGGAYETASLSGTTNWTGLNNPTVTCV